MDTTVWTQRRSAAEHHRPGDQRSPWQRDRARVLHSAAFRRLQAKTQIMSIGENDFYRTRLTHSLEASQIGAALVEQLQGKLDTTTAAVLPAPPLMETLCLAHDLGHPPFGHGGEFALNYRMLGHGGFEGNGQTLRVVARLEPYTDGFGMDLTRRALLGLLKYPIVAPASPQPLPAANDPRPLTAFRPAKAVFPCDEAILDWILAPLGNDERERFQSVEPLTTSPWGRSRFKSLDASIMEIADDIAYGVHDLEDAVVTGTVDRESWTLDAMSRFEALPESLRRAMQDTTEALFAREHHRRKHAIGALVNRFITAVELEEALPDAPTALIRLNACLPEAERALLDMLKGYVSDHVIQQPAIQRARYRCQHSLLAMFDAFASEPQRLLPRNTRERWQAAGEEGPRVLCDYMAGMTDDYAQRMHATLFGPG